MSSPEPTPAPTQTEAQTPARRMGALPALALVAGSMLGIGIFISPPEVAAKVGSPGWFLAMWIIGGLTSLFGALSLAELGAMMPKDGGDYSYLRESYGGGVAFAAGWLQLLAIFPGSLAAVAVATAKYQLPVLLGDWANASLTVGPLSLPMSHLVAAGLIIGLTAINHVGVKVSGQMQVVVTSIPIAVLLVSTIAVLAHDNHLDGIPAAGPSTETTLVGLASAYLPVYFAFSGWNAAIYVGGEIKNPGRNLPRALLGGTMTVTLLYLVLCVGFLAVFSLQDLASAGEAGTAAARAIFGPAGIVAIAGLIFLAMVGSLNGTVLTGSRIGFAMAKQGDFARTAGDLHPRFGTPTVALWAQAGIALLLLSSGADLDKLIDYTSSAMLITGTLTVLSVMVLRRRRADLHRPYRTFFYPWPPILYAVSAVVVLVVLIAKGDPSVWLAVAWFAAALGVHWLWSRRRSAKSA